MDPLTLLRELFGEESIRKVVTSGFDSVHKIAATTPESLSFFTGINEALARQIQASAVESLSAPSPADYRGSLAGSAEGQTDGDPALPAKPRVPPPSRPPVSSGEKISLDLMDENPLLDAGGILKSVAQEPRPKDIMDDDFLDEVGLSDAEANFLEGISPWPGEAPRREKTSAAPPDVRPAAVAPVSGREEKEVEYASVTDWSPDKDPDPVPRLVRAPELGPVPSGRAEETAEAVPVTIPLTLVASPAPDLETAKTAPEEGAGPGTAAAPGGPAEEPSLWKFGK
jgi:hypothetical protein